MLRVPGLGYANVDRILRIRRYHKLTLENLKKLHVRLKDAIEYVITADHLPMKANALFESVPPVPATLELAVEGLEPLSKELPRHATKALQMPLFAEAAQSAVTGVL